MAVELRLREMPDYDKPKDVSRRSRMVTLEEALRARAQFLSSKPWLRAYQAEIDRTLQNVIGFESRMAVLRMMMQVKTHQLKDAVLLLGAQAK